MRVLRAVMVLLGTINVLLALNFWPVIPLLGWLNFGHAGWLTAWIPDVVLLTILPAGYALYWHLWFVSAGLALVCSAYISRRWACRRARIWAGVSCATILLYVAVRVFLQTRGIQPDIV